jgi:pyruvate formate lyase activating enzyme
LHAARDRGITTAIETTGYAEMSVIRRLLPYVDTVLMDIKHVDGEKHKEFTTRDNGLILDNARQIAREANELIVRTPVIPTFNDTPEEIGAIADFARSLGTVREMHLLPYHRIGSDKYAGLGRPYAMAHIQPPPREQMEGLLAVVRERGLRGQIGG